MLNEHGICYSFDGEMEQEDWPMCRMSYEVIHLPSMTRYQQWVRVDAPGRFAELLAIWNEKAPDLWRYAPC